MNRYFLYLDKESWLHRLDPRTKVLGLLGFFLVTLIFSDPRFLAVPTIFILILTATAGALGNARKIWILLALLFVYCLLLWPFFVEGQTPLFLLAGHVITEEAARFGLGMGLRLNAMLLGGLLLLSTTTIEAFTLALQRLGLPASMSFALSLAFRWVPSLLGAADTIVQAQRARGLDITAGTLLARLRRYPPLLVPLIGHQLRHTRLLAMALESKGFGPDVHRRAFLELRMTTRDWLILVLVAATVLFCGWLRWEGYGSIDVRF